MVRVYFISYYLVYTLSVFEYVILWKRFFICIISVFLSYLSIVSVTILSCVNYWMCLDVLHDFFCVLCPNQVQPDSFKPLYNPLLSHRKRKNRSTVYLCLWFCCYVGMILSSALWTLEFCKLKSSLVATVVHFLDPLRACTNLSWLMAKA